MSDVDHTQSEAVIAELRAENAALRRELEQYKPHARDGCVPYGTFLFTISQIRGGTVYGACADYARASTTPGCRVVTIAEMTQFKAKGRVPVWVMDQLPQMQFKARMNPPKQVWTDRENEFLAECQKVEHSQAKLAALCAQRFGRLVTKNSIKGKLDRLDLNQPRVAKELVE